MYLITVMSIAFFPPKTVESIFRRKFDNVTYSPITLLVCTYTFRCHYCRFSLLIESQDLDIKDYLFIVAVITWTYFTYWIL